LVGIADADGDGVDDADDQFPNDPNLAYETFILPIKIRLEP